MTVIEAEALNRHAHVDGAAAFGRRLRRTRLERGLSQRDIAFPGCTAAYLCRIEHGDRVPSLQIIRRLASKLHVNPSWLANGAGDSTPALTIEIPARAVDEWLRVWSDGGLGLADLTPDERGRLVAELEQTAADNAGPMAGALLSLRETPA